MPNYDYECQICAHRFEIFQSMNDPKLTDCPQEGCTGQVKRLLGTGGGILFKGAGFYETDYRSSSYKEGAKAESSKGESKSETKSETKPSTKSESKSVKSGGE
jgi:putative FmdB family regulatory protein